MARYVDTDFSNFLLYQHQQLVSQVYQNSNSSASLSHHNCHQHSKPCFSSIFQAEIQQNIGFVRNNLFNTILNSCAKLIPTQKQTSATQNTPHPLSSPFLHFPTLPLSSTLRSNPPPLDLQYFQYRRMEGSTVKLGFYDCRSNTFYEVQSMEQYEQCLQHYYKVMQEEESKQHQLSLDYLYDFDEVMGELDKNQTTQQRQPELQEYQF